VENVGCADDTETGTIEVLCERSAAASLPRSFASSMLQTCEDVMMSGFRGDEETLATMKAEVLCQNATQQSELSVRDHTQPEFAAVQVAAAVRTFCGINQMLFVSERDYMISPIHLSSVCNAPAPYSGGSYFLQYFYGIRYPGHPLTSTENSTEIVPGEPLHQGS